MATKPQNQRAVGVAGGQFAGVEEGNDAEGDDRHHDEGGVVEIM